MTNAAHIQTRIHRGYGKAASKLGQLHSLYRGRCLCPACSTRTGTLADQLRDDTNHPVVLINTFVVPDEDADALLNTWSRDATIMKCQPGFISTQLHRGIAGSGTFLNYAVWQSVAHFRDDRGRAARAESNRDATRILARGARCRK